jgi:hypothetical protein
MPLPSGCVETALWQPLLKRIVGPSSDSGSLLLERQHTGGESLDDRRQGLEIGSVADLEAMSPSASPMKRCGRVQSVSCAVSRLHRNVAPARSVG